MEDKTPHEVWTSKKPSLSHRRVFGCDAYVHVLKEKRSNHLENDEDEDEKDSMGTNQTGNQ